MTDVSCIGLGLMGSALARALLKSGHSVTVWNRTASRAQLIADEGAGFAGDVSKALTASPVVLFCVDGYQTTRDLVCTHDKLQLLGGRIVVQLSTGTPSEARDAYRWFMEHGADYLDGAILGGPAAIGTSRVQILYSGSEEAFSRIAPVLSSLGERSRFVGSDAGAASAIDLAWLANRFGIYLSAAYGSLLCGAEGIELAKYAEVFGPEDPARWVVDAIRADAFRNPTATLSVWNASLRMIQRQARERGMDVTYPDFVAGILDRAEKAGFGNEHIASMVKVLRGADRET